MSASTVEYLTVRTRVDKADGELVLLGDTLLELKYNDLWAKAMVLRQILEGLREEALDRIAMEME